jgi:hypothetical protein
MNRRVLQSRYCSRRMRRVRLSNHDLMARIMRADREAAASARHRRFPKRCAVGRVTGS